jgi:serine phosphatase RsbU (regulator of sigma subunit)
MAQVALKKLFGPRQDASALVAAIAAVFGGPMAIEDSDGRILYGEAVSPHAGRYPVILDGVRQGWVSGTEPARAVATLLDHLLSKEVERKALGAEVLHLYREVNLIYSFSEKLAALLDLKRVALTTLQEARYLIAASDGVIMLRDDHGRLETIAAFGDAAAALHEVRVGAGVIGGIVARGDPEIVNYVPVDPRAIREETAVGSLIAAPLKVGEQVIGIIALASVTPRTYTAGDLKLLNTLALQTATAIENARLFERTVQAAQERERLLTLHKEAEVARAKLESEFDLAARIQADLFPATLPYFESYDLAALNRPARRCGGDYYDAIPVHRPGGAPGVLLCVADVSGKGMPAALLMSNMQATLRALLGQTRSLTELATLANELLFASTAPNKYVTAALFEMDVHSGAAQFVSAGHVDCLLLDGNGKAQRLESTGAPLGLLSSGMPCNATNVTMVPGDCLVLYSDGIPDAQNEAGEEFSEERLVEAVRASVAEPAQGIVTRVFEAIDRFAGAAPQFDDITMIVLRRL